MNKLFFKISLQEKMLFCRHLSIAIKSGMTLIDALKMIKNQATSKSFFELIKTLIIDISNGNFLSKSLEKFRRSFGELFISVIKVAEASGTLPENLNYLADELKKRREIINKVRGAMIYPIIIMVVTIIIAASMLIFVFPKLLPIFKSLNVALPLTTKMLIVMAGFLSNYGFWVLAGLIMFIIGFIMLLRVNAFKLAIHRALIYLPIFGKIVIGVNVVNTSRTLALLLRSGMKIVESITITANTMTNLSYKHELLLAAELVQRGEFFSRYLAQRKKYFPDIFANMVEVGENTGNLTQNLDYLSEYYASEVDDFIKNLSSVLEPILLVFMGVVVGFIALSFITPIYKLTQGIR